MNTNQRRSLAGTSLVELLVVIVILLVGILAVIQVFPRGLQIIAVERNKTVMTNLARYEVERIRGNISQLPEQILPVKYVFSGPTVTILADSTRNPNDLGPSTPYINGNGDILDGASNPLGSWPYLSGPNNFRRVIAEGGAIPAARYVGASYGSLMTLEFAPAVFNPAYTSLFEVYGNDMNRRYGDPGFGRVRSYEFFVDQADTPSATLYLPGSPTVNRTYRIAMTAWVNNGTANVRREVLDYNFTVTAGSGTTAFSLSNAAALGGGESFLGCEFDSVRVARNFTPVASFTVGGSPDDTAYEYILLDETLGLILFNPIGHKYTERRGNRTVPLVARVNYDVYDWRIIKDDFRISDEIPSEHRLGLSNLMHKGSSTPDQKQHTGLNVFVTDELGGTENRDFILLDLATGGIYSKASLNIDYSQGIVQIKDFDNDPTNGVQARLWYPGAASAVTVLASGRHVRALYQAMGEWAIQTTKAASSYRLTLGTPAAAQYYAGGSSLYYTGVPYAAGEGQTRIYFPPMDAGKKVTIGELYYDVAGGGEPRKLENQDFLITNSPIDAAVGLPYVDIRTIASDALSINYARYGYGVRNVQGSSLTVKVFWNPAFFTLSNDQTANLNTFEDWGRNWRRMQTDTILRKETEF